MVTDLLLPERGIATPKPPSYIKLDMAFGVGAGAKLLDKSRYHSHGTISGASWATGHHGYCLDFDPDEPSYVEIPASHTQLDFTSEDFSIIARAKLDVVTDRRQIFMRGLYNTGGWSFLNFEGAYLYLWLFQSGGSTRTRSAIGALSIDTLYTLGATRKGTIGKVYIDGVDVTDASDSLLDPVTCARSAKIGIYDDKTSSPLDGKMEFLRVFGGIALSASEHLAWHRALA